MINVLVIGSTGYVGLPLCQALLRSGAYTVYGLCRSEAKAKTLAQHEILPILGDASEPSSYVSLLGTTPIDIVIDASTAYDQAYSILETVKSASKQRIEALATESGAIGAKMGYVYISGTWVHGAPLVPASDLHPIGSKALSRSQPAEVSQWRPEFEQKVLASRDVLDVAIARPGAVYGGKTWLFEDLWGPIVDAAKKQGGGESVKVPVAEDARIGVIHVEDVASGVGLVVDRLFGGLGSWPVYDLVTETVAIRGMLEGVRTVAGCQGEIGMVGPGDHVFHKALSLKAKAGAGERARQMLGWRPKRVEMLERLEIFVKAFEAGRGD